MKGSMFKGDVKSLKKYSKNCGRTHPMPLNAVMLFRQEDGKCTLPIKLGNDIADGNYVLIDNDILPIKAETVNDLARICGVEGSGFAKDEGELKIRYISHLIEKQPFAHYNLVEQFGKIVSIQKRERAMPAAVDIAHLFAKERHLLVQCECSDTVVRAVIYQDGNHSPAIILQESSGGDSGFLVIGGLREGNGFLELNRFSYPMYKKILSSALLDCIREMYAEAEMTSTNVLFSSKRSSPDTSHLEEIIGKKMADEVLAKYKARDDSTLRYVDRMSILVELICSRIRDFDAKRQILILKKMSDNLRMD